MTKIKKIKKILVLTITFLFFISSFSQLVQAADMLDALTVPWGYNVYQGRNEYFNSTYYDDTNYRQQFTEAWFETQFVDDSSLYYNDSLSNLDTLETKYPLDSSIYTINGTLNANGTLNSLDDDYANLSSSEAGHYPATYSFTNEVVGTSGTDIDFVDHVGLPNDCFCEIISDLDGHKKVIELYHDSGGDDPSFYHYFSDKTIETVEFWWGSSDATHHSALFLEGDGGARIGVWINAEVFGSNLGGTGITALDNVLYHHKIEWNCAIDEFTWYINDIKVVDNGNFAVAGTNINLFRIKLYTNTPYSSYLDSYGELWDPDYNIGNNLFWSNYFGTETFENYNKTESTGYYDGSYDSNDESISVDGDYYGTYDFNDESVSTSGDYYGTYSFTDEDVGTSGDNIEFVSWWDGIGILDIVASEGTHNKVLRYVYEGGQSFMNSFSPQTSGTMDLWVSLNNTDDFAQIYVRRGSTALCKIRFDGGDLYYYNSTGAYDSGTDYIADTWYHVRFVWRNDDTYDVYWNGVKIVDNVSTMDSVDTGATNITFYLHTNAGTLYLDAVGYSWDENYAVGDNYNKYGLTSDVSDFIDYYSNGYECSAGIISSLGGHNNVLEMDDNTNGAQQTIQNTFLSAQTSGTVEFWVRGDDVSLQFRFILYNSSYQQGIDIEINSDKITYIAPAGGGNQDATDGGVVNSVWYHIRIDFECGDGSYKGLAADTYDFYLNGTLLDTGVDFRKVSDSLFYFRFLTSTSNLNYIYYLDAIGYSWDTTSHDGKGYNIGDNLNKYGLTSDVSEFIISYANTYDCSTGIISSLGGHNNILELYDNSGTAIYVHNIFSSQTSGTIEFWIRTSDASDDFNIHIREGGSVRINFVISGDKWWWQEAGGWLDWGNILDNTWYHVRIDFDCGTDTADVYINGTLDQSDVDFLSTATNLNSIRFTTDSVDITTICIDAIGYSWDTSYNTGDNINSHGSAILDALKSNGWDIDLDPYCSIGIDGEFNSHKKILELFDNTTNGVSSLMYLFDSSQTTGTIEFYLKSNDVSDVFTILLRDGSTYAIRIRIYSDKIQYKYSSTWNDATNGNVNDNQWYHIQIDFSSVTDTYSFYLNGTLLDSGISFENVVSNCDDFTMFTELSLYDYTYFIDSLGYSWDPNYNISDNLHAYGEATLNFTCYVDLLEFISNILELEASGYYMTSTYQNITFSIWNYTSLQWFEINNSINNLSFFLSRYLNNDTISNLVDSNGRVLFNFYGYNTTNEFEFYLDMLKVKSYRKLLLSNQRALDILGAWKYRWHVIDTSYASDWTYFNVILPIENVQMISESNYETEWEFVYTEYSGDTINLYNETFGAGSDYWDLYGVLPRYIENKILNGTYLEKNFTKEEWTYTGTNYYIGQDTYPKSIHFYDGYWYMLGSQYDEIYKYYSNWTYTSTSYPVGSQDIYPMSIHFYDGYWYMLGSQHDEIYKYYSNWTYTGTSYPVISQSNAPFSIHYYDGYWWMSEGQHTKVYKYNLDWTYTGTSYPVGSQDISPFSINYYDGYWWMCGDQYNRVYKYNLDWTYTGTYYSVGSQNDEPHSIHYYDGYWWMCGWENRRVYKYNVYDISKNYQGNGTLYCQTDETEILTLRSPNDLNLNLQAGDKIDITYNLTSTNKIDLNLRNDDAQQSSFTLSEQGNNFFSTRTKSFFVQSDISIDQLEFTGTFDDTKNLIIDNVLIYRYNESAEGKREIYYLDSSSFLKFYLDYPVDYSISVYEENILREEFNLTTSRDLQTLTFEKVFSDIVYVSFYDLNNEYLNFQSFTTYVNYTLKEIEYTNERLSTHIMYVDEGTTIGFMVYDSFSISVINITKSEEIFIDLTLDVYSLKIKNEATEFVSYSLSKGDVTKTGNILSEEIEEFIVSSGNYVFNYTNMEESEEYYPIHTVNINLVEDSVLIINTTYYNPYIGLFTYDGLGLDYDLVRFYINEERRDFGFNTIKTRVANFIVLDYFNNTLTNETVDMEGVSEYNIFVEVYTLNLLNQFDFADIIVNISQEASGIWMSQVIPSEFALSYRFIPNLNYTIVASFDNGTVYDTRTINLTTNSQIQSFGVRTTAPEFPKDVYFGVYSNTGIGIEQNKLKFYIDNVRSDFGFSTVDKPINNLKVKDYLDNVLFNQNINVSGILEYNILIDIYNLKVKNEAFKSSNISIQIGSNSIEETILTEEIAKYQLLPNNYTFLFTNGEDGKLTNITINLNNNREIVINTTYYQIYFGLYNFYRFVNEEEVKFYINNTRADFGFNTLKSDYTHFLVYDYFNSALFSRTVYTRNLTEYSIFISAYSLLLYNNYSHEVKFQITRGNITVERFVESREHVEFKLFPNLEYEIKALYVNGTEIEEETVELDEEYKIVSFGFYSAEFPIIPVPLLQILNQTIMLIIFVIIVTISIGIIAIITLKIRSENKKIPSTVRKEFKELEKPKKSSKVFDNRDLYR